jgi:hypothetical protein
MPSPTLSVHLDLSSLREAGKQLDQFVAVHGPQVEHLTTQINSALSPENQSVRPFVEIAEDIGRADEAIRRLSPEVQRFVNFTGLAFSRLGANITQSLWGQRVKFSRVFRAMAQDFVTYFVEAVLRSVSMRLVTGLLRLLHIFDVPSNDAMIETEGRRAGSFFARGFLSQIESLGDEMRGVPTQTDGQLPTPVMSVHVHNATPETWVELVDRHIEPRLRRNERVTGRGYRLAAYTETD